MDNPIHFERQIPTILFLIIKKKKKGVSGQCLR